MNLLEKFDRVKICADNCITEADRQFFQRQQAIYQDAVEGFYQIAVLWTDMCNRQKVSLSDSEDMDDTWKKKYLVSLWWPEITVGKILNHISTLHKEFIFTVVSYLNDTYHLSLDADNVKDGLFPEELKFTGQEETVDWSKLSPVVLRYENAIELILSWFHGRTFEEQAPYELTEQCHLAAWREHDHKANFEQKKNLVKLLGGACEYGSYGSRQRWHIHKSAKNILKALAYFETGAFSQYPDGINDLLSEEYCLWYDLWELEDCEKLEKIKLFKNGRMDIRFTSEDYARQFVNGYLGTIW